MRVWTFLFLALSTIARAQECTDQWDTYFDTDPLHSKYLSGDTSTGYAVFSFWGNPNVMFEIRGEFPHSRFMSFETEATRLAISEDHLFDFDVVPDAGSENPFLENVNLSTPNRSFRVFAMQDKPTGAVNTVQLPNGLLSASIMFRIYSPNEGVTLSRKDLPRIYALDKATGAPVACPRRANYDPQFHFPEVLADLYTMVKPFEFKVAGDMKIAGLNKAAGYMFAVTPQKRDEVVTVKFRAPSFFNSRKGEGVFTSGFDVRYWSFCTSNFPKNQTLNCVPDFAAKPDANGDVTVVVGAGDAVKSAAESRGYSFLPDTRKAGQRVMGFVYRNLLPNARFQTEQMYQGDYVPRASICSAADFLTADCH